MTLLIIAVIAFGLSVTCTAMVRTLARRWGVVDKPDAAPDRKRHERPVPLLGGVAIFGALLLTVALVWIVQPSLFFGGYLLPKHLLGVLSGGLLLVIMGVFDDVRRLSVAPRIVCIAVAALLVIAAGIGIPYLSNPLGETIRLDQWARTLFSLRDVPYRLVLPADLFALLWLMAAMYATKLLDGLDGLVSGVTVIGSLILFSLSMTQKVGQPETALLAAIVAGTFLGFLLFNFHPATIFLGEAGSLLAGFLLGVLAIISGGKIATALLILGIPMLDLIWVVLRRLARNRSALSWAQADRTHLHFRLVDMGLSVRQAVLLLYVLTAVFGSATLFFEGKEKLVVLGLVVLTMVVLAGWVVRRSRRRGQKNAAAP